MDEEVKAKATQMIEAIQKIWPNTPVPTVVLTLFEVQVRVLMAAGSMSTAEALESLQAVLDHVKEKNA